MDIGKARTGRESGAPRALAAWRRIQRTAFPPPRRANAVRPYDSARAKPMILYASFAAS
jgi:hypothetical protein